MVFQEKCFSRYILLPDQISLSGCFYKVKLKVFFIILKGLSIAKKCLRPEIVSLKKFLSIDDTQK